MFETDIGETGEHTGSFLYFSIPYYWVREAWLASHTKGWQLILATVESAHRSRGGYKETIRLEVLYSYAFGGQSYTGRVIRDTAFCSGKVDAALAEYLDGSKVPIRVDPSHPERSYLPSGLGWLEPFLTAFLSLGSLALIVVIILSAALSAIHSR